MTPETAREGKTVIPYCWVNLGVSIMDANGKRQPIRGPSYRNKNPAYDSIYESWVVLFDKRNEIAEDRPRGLDEADHIRALGINWRPPELHLFPKARGEKPRRKTYAGQHPFGYYQPLY